MTVQRAIELSIEGGWRAAEKPFIDKSETGWVTVGFNNVTTNVLVWHHEILLDPSFWQCLGKRKGWEYHHAFWCYANEKGGKCDCSPEDEKLYHWHRLIDHLADGGTIESYFATLDDPTPPEGD